MTTLQILRFWGEQDTYEIFYFYSFSQKYLPHSVLYINQVRTKVRAPELCSVSRIRYLTSVTGRSLTSSQIGQSVVWYWQFCVNLSWISNFSLNISPKTVSLVETLSVSVKGLPNRHLRQTRPRQTVEVDPLLDRRMFFSYLFFPSTFASYIDNISLVLKVGEVKTNFSKEQNKTTMTHHFYI